MDHQHGPEIGMDEIPFAPPEDDRLPEEPAVTVHRARLGRRHRADGPAVETSAGVRLWYVDGRLDRRDGPAIETDWGYSASLVGGEWRGAEMNGRPVTWLACKAAAKELAPFARTYVDGVERYAAATGRSDGARDHVDSARQYEGPDGDVREAVEEIENAAAEVCGRLKALRRFVEAGTVRGCRADAAPSEDLARMAELTDLVRAEHAKVREQHEKIEKALAETRLFGTVRTALLSRVSSADTLEEARRKYEARAKVVDGLSSSWIPAVATRILSAAAKAFGAYRTIREKPEEAGEVLREAAESVAKDAAEKAKAAALEEGSEFAGGLIRLKLQSFVVGRSRARAEGERDGIERDFSAAVARTRDGAGIPAEELAGEIDAALRKLASVRQTLRLLQWDDDMPATLPLAAAACIGQAARLLEDLERRAMPPVPALSADVGGVAVLEGLRRTLAAEAAQGARIGALAAGLAGAAFAPDVAKLAPEEVASAQGVAWPRGTHAVEARPDGSVRVVDRETGRLDNPLGPACVSASGRCVYALNGETMDRRTFAARRPPVADPLGIAPEAPEPVF